MLLVPGCSSSRNHSLTGPRGTPARNSLLSRARKQAVPYASFCKLVLITGALLAQQHSLKFEVASIKPSGPGEQGTIRYPHGGRFSASNITVMNLVTYAFEIPQKQVTGVPSWLTSDRFDISAVPENGGDQDTPDNSRKTRLRVQSLLVERFSLRYHHVTEEHPILVLLVEKGGPKIEPNSGKPFEIVRTGRSQTTFQKVTMATVAQALSGQLASAELGRPVVDRTGLTGEFDLVLDWTPEVVLPARVVKGSHDLGGPSIFTALHQLGLRLQSDKGPVDILAIDHVEKPSEN